VTIWIDASNFAGARALDRPDIWHFCRRISDIGLRDGTDREIFLAAKEQSTIVMTKDADFVRLLEELGPPPQIIWITCGNTSNARLKQLFRTSLPRAMELLSLGESLVEVSDVREPSGEKP